jgi:predicted Mrr-cat superfamily restriction endonuclease
MSPANLRGVSGVVHEVDIASSPDPELKEKLILIEARTADIAVNSQEIMNFAAKIFDLKPSSAVFIAIPKLDEAAAKLANSYGITVIEATDIAEAVKQLEELKSSIIKQ